MIQSARKQHAGQQSLAFAVFEENRPVIEVWFAMDTQWRVISGMSAVIQGLDFSVLPLMFDACGIPAADRPAMIRQIKLMERAALREFASD